MVFSDQFSGHNTQEVKADLSYLIEKQCFETRSDLANFKEEVSSHFNDEKLISTIQKLFKQEAECNEKTTPAHDFLTQLCLIRCGFGHFTKIDSDLGTGSREGIKALKKMYNNTFRLAPLLPILENTQADLAFFKAATEIINTTPRPNPLQAPTGIETVDRLDTTYFLGHSFVEGYPSNNKLGIRGATVSKMNEQIRNNPEMFKNGVKGKKLIIDLGINDLFARNSTPQQLIQNYNNLIGTIRNPQKGNYQGPIHIVGISEVNKIIGKKSITESNQRINQANNALAIFSSQHTDIIFHPRKLGKNISADGIHARDSTLARNQVLDLVYTTPLQPQRPQPYSPTTDTITPYGSIGKIIIPKEKKETNKMSKYGEQLDTGDIVTITESSAQSGRIEQFIPQKDYKIVLNYENTTSRYKTYTSVKAHRDATLNTYVVDDPNSMPHGSGNRALIYPGVRVMKQRENIVIDKIETHITPPKSLEGVTLPIMPRLTYENISDKERGEACANILRAFSLSNIAIAAFLGNGRVEGFDWKNTGKRFWPGVNGDNGKSLGIFQFNKSKKTDFKAYAKEHGCDPHDYYIQICYMIKDLKTNYNNTYTKILNAKNVEEATYVFASQYERPRASFIKLDNGKTKRISFKTARNQKRLKERIEAAEMFV